MQSASQSNTLPRAEIITAGVYATVERELSIQTDAPEVAAYVRRVYAPAALPSPSGALPFDRGLILAERAQVLFNGERLPLAAHESGDAFRAGFYGSSRLVRASLGRQSTRTTLHAAAVRVGDAAVIFVAKPFGGKTTLTLAMLERGALLYSDEFVTVEQPSRDVAGIRRTLHVRETSLDAIAQPAIRRHCTLAPGRTTPLGWRVWDDVDPRDAFGPGVFAEPAPLRAVIAIEPATEEASSPLVPISPLTAALAVSDRLTLPGPGFERYRTAVDLCEGVACFRLAIGSAQAAAERIFEAVC
ncbi:MAG: hypothetical protein GIW95_11805 [Candidatus Eremiobacteraeota bacterium]|nr:hypothetical protein [Candidatus Eremiobacteraeota bacterium]